MLPYRSELIKINEIFYSIQGESLFVGKPTVFVRTATCNLRCSWCDTKYSFWEGRLQTIDDILADVAKHPTQYVCVTGGEPLGQKATFDLLSRLIEKKYIVSLETGGGVSVRGVPPEVVKVIDIKCPDSGETESMVWENLDLVDRKDQFKFVIASENDFLWANALCEEKKLGDRCSLLFSPVYGKVSPEKLADWVLKSGLPATYQLQLHKAIWGERRGV